MVCVVLKVSKKRECEHQNHQFLGLYRGFLPLRVLYSVFASEKDWNTVKCPVVLSLCVSLLFVLVTIYSTSICVVMLIKVLKVSKKRGVKGVHTRSLGTAGHLTTPFPQTGHLP